MSENYPKTKAQQREATMARLIDVSTPIFTRDGYANAAMEEIVQQAGVTRGALYHHFGSKEGLFKAVLARVQQGVQERIEAAAARYEDPWSQLIAGSLAFLEVSLEPEVQRIMLIDAPAAVGWSVWREIDSQHSMASLQEAISTLIETWQLPTFSVAAVTHLLSGAMNEAALWIAQSENPAKALKEGKDALTFLLMAMRQHNDH